MKITHISVVAGFVACATFASATAGFAGSADEVKKPGLERVQMLRVRLPHGLCEFDRPLPANLVDKLRTRRDFDRLLSYMLINCPTLALPLADAATASIGDVDEDGEDGSAPILPLPGDDGTGNDDGGDTGGDDTASDDDDGNNGHGNDDDGHDESNPGNG